MQNWNGSVQRIEWWCSTTADFGPVWNPWQQSTSISISLSLSNALEWTKWAVVSLYCRHYDGITRHKKHNFPLNQKREKTGKQIYCAYALHSYIWDGFSNFKCSNTHVCIETFRKFPQEMKWNNNEKNTLEPALDHTHTHTHISQYYCYLQSLSRFKYILNGWKAAAAIFTHEHAKILCKMFLLYQFPSCTFFSISFIGIRLGIFLSLLLFGSFTTSSLPEIISINRNK